MKVIVELITYMSVEVNVSDLPTYSHEAKISSTEKAERAVRNNWDSYYAMRAEPMPEKGGRVLTVKAVPRG